MNDFLKCACPHCGQSIEYPAEGTGQTVPCPTCAKLLTLRPANSSTKFGSIVIPPGSEFVQQKPKSKKSVGTNLGKLMEETIRARTKTGDTPLHRAAKIGRIYEIPSHLLQTELFLVKNYHRQTPLHVAAKYGHLNQIPLEFLNKETISALDDRGDTPLHTATSYNHADKIPVELLTLEFLSLPSIHKTYKETRIGETVLHALARQNQLSKLPSDCITPEMWELKNQYGLTVRQTLEEIIGLEHRHATVRGEPATEQQKGKLRYFGCTWQEPITKGQASDAIDECVRRFPNVDRAYYNQPATEEQLARLQEISGYPSNDPNNPDNDSEPYYDPAQPPTYGQAKDLIRDWELWENEQVKNSDLDSGNSGPRPTRHHWADDYDESERAYFDSACLEILDKWQFKFGDLPTRKQVLKTWELVKSRKSNKTEFPTHSELVAALIELSPKFKSPPVGR